MSDFVDEFLIRQPRTLVMEYTHRCFCRVVVQPGGGGVARAIEDAVRICAGMPNVDPESIRFRMEDEE